MNIYDSNVAYSYPPPPVKGEVEYGNGGSGGQSITGDANQSYSYNPDFRGHEEERHCTDVAMLVIFLIFLCGMLGLLFYTLPKSQVMYLYMPTDHRGLLCDYDNRLLAVNNSETLPNLEGKPYLFWVRPGKMGYARSFCVEKCPEAGLFSDAFIKIALPGFMDGLANDTNCGSVKATIRNYSEPDSEQSKGYFCPYNSSLLFRRCFPNSGAFDNANNISSYAGLSDNLSSTWYAAALSDVIETKWTIVFAVVFALVLSCLWLVTLRITAGFFIWLTVALTVVVSGGLTYLCYAQKEDLFKNSTAAEAYSLGLYSQSFNKDFFTIMYYVMIGVDVIVLLLLLFLAERIQLSISIIEIVSKVFGEVKMLFLFPSITYLLVTAWWVYCALVGVVLFGAGKSERVAYNSDYQVYDRIDFTYDSTIQYLSIYHFVGFLWVSCFIFALSEMTVAGVFAKYYFNREPRRENMGSSPIWDSLKRSLYYHTGSLALGSLIITICKIIRIIIEYIKEKTKDAQSTALQYLLKCLSCCFWCLEKFLQYLNRNAYVLIAIHGYSFFSGCVQAFNLIIRNCVRVATINWVGDFSLFLGRVFVSGAVTVLSIVLFMNNEKVSFFAVPAIIVFFLSYIIAGAFTQIFEIGIDSMFLCFMEDEERNDGSPGREKFAPPELAEHLQVKSQAPVIP